MPRELYCRYEKCDFHFEATAGMLPVVCPGCKKTGKWATVPTLVRAADPTVAYVLTVNDKRFLKALHIETV